MNLELINWEAEYRKNHEYVEESVVGSGISDWRNHETHLRKHHEEMEDKKQHLHKVYKEI